MAGRGRGPSSHFDNQSGHHGQSFSNAASDFSFGRGQRRQQPWKAQQEYGTVAEFPCGRGRGLGRGRGRGFGRGRDFVLEQQQNQSERLGQKRKFEDLPKMFEEKANIQQLKSKFQSDRNFQKSQDQRLDSADSRFNNSRCSTHATNWKKNQHQPNQKFHSGRNEFRDQKQNQQKNNRKPDTEDHLQEKVAGRSYFPHNWSQSRAAYGNHNKKDELFYLSKTMSRLLRHEAAKYGLRMKSDGYVFVNELLQCAGLCNRFMEDDVRTVVEDNDKKRFQLKVDLCSERLMVKANQGHTFTVQDLELEPILDASEAPVVVHGTYLDVWSLIEHQGLSRMSRNHIHFAVGKPGEGGVISGMRKTSQVLIFINMKKALEDGIQFFRSANNVILSPGDSNGVILPKYFDRVDYCITGDRAHNAAKQNPTLIQSCSSDHCDQPQKTKKKKVPTATLR